MISPTSNNGNVHYILIGVLIFHILKYGNFNIRILTRTNSDGFMKPYIQTESSLKKSTHVHGSGETVHTTAYNKRSAVPVTGRGLP